MSGFTLHLQSIIFSVLRLPDRLFGRIKKMLQSDCEAVIAQLSQCND